MKTDLWFHVNERLPKKTGYYLAFKGMSMGDDETGTDYYYWDAITAEWRDSSLSTAYYANVIYWSTADPGAWYDNELPGHMAKKKNAEVNPAIVDAWAAVEQAIERYNIVKALVETNESRS